MKGKRRMLRGKMEKAKQGKFFGGRVPYGYVWNESDKRYEIVESEAEIIRLIFNLCIEGLSTERIRDHLNASGYPNPVGLKGYSHGRELNSWGKSTVRYILANSMYAGEFLRWRHKRVDRKIRTFRPQDEWIISQAPTIITKGIFEMAQEALKSRRALSKREYLLSGLIYCESCGCKMTGERCTTRRKNNKEDRYYACWNGRRRHLGKECPSKSVRIEDIEAPIWEEIKKLLKNPALLKQAILQSEAIDPSEENLKELTKLLEDKETEEERLLDLY